MQLKRKLFNWVLVRICVALVILAYCLCGCIPFPTSDYSIDLPKGYSLVRQYSQTVCLCNAEGSVVVQPHVDAYQVLPNVIVGHVQKHKDQYWKSVPGYFVVDTTTGKVYQGLSEAAWLKHLRKFGVRSRPVLQRTRD